MSDAKHTPKKHKTINARPVISFHRSSDEGIIYQARVSGALMRLIPPFLQTILLPTKPTKSEYVEAGKLTKRRLDALLYVEPPPAFTKGRLSLLRR